MLPFSPQFLSKDTKLPLSIALGFCTRLTIVTITALRGPSETPRGLKFCFSNQQRSHKICERDIHRGCRSTWHAHYVGMCIYNDAPGGHSGHDHKIDHHRRVCLQRGLWIVRVFELNGQG
jgi:hypothetical protein